jgi:uncharacterized protein (DUF1697 family)
MTVFVALLRGINVGGKHALPMQALRDILAASGCERVATYIQSGNAVFRCSTGKQILQKKITAAIAQQFGFTPRVLLLADGELRAIMAANPFPAAVDTPSMVHVWFPVEPVRKPDLAALNALRAATEQYVLAANAFYLHAPDGIGRSRLAARVEQLLGVEATARNWRTVSKVAALAAAVTD